MSDNPPDYVAARIRQSVPSGIPIVHGSTPVVSFGDASHATVATLGLNPSRREFLGEDGKELTGCDRRLESVASVGESDLTSASDEVVRRIFEACNSYFQGRPYRRWFDRLELLLKPLGFSYYDRSACHLDLVQWATDPVWGCLSRSNQEQLLKTGVSFLAEQLRENSVELLLLNGARVVEVYETSFCVHLTREDILPGTRIRLFHRVDTPGLKIVGWNLNLQGNRASNLEIQTIAGQIKKLIQLGQSMLRPPW